MTRQNPQRAKARKPLKPKGQSAKSRVRQKHAISPQAASSATPMLDWHREAGERMRRSELLDLEIKIARKQLAVAPAVTRTLSDEELKKMKALTHKRAGEMLGGIKERAVRLLIEQGKLNKTATGKTAVDEKFFIERDKRLTAKT